MIAETSVPSSSAIATEIATTIFLRLGIVLCAVACDALVSDFVVLGCAPILQIVLKTLHKIIIQIKPINTIATPRMQTNEIGYSILHRLTVS